MKIGTNKKETQLCQWEAMHTVQEFRTGSGSGHLRSYSQVLRLPPLGDCVIRMSVTEQVQPRGGRQGARAAGGERQGLGRR